MHFYIIIVDSRNVCRQEHQQHIPTGWYDSAKNTLPRLIVCANRFATLHMAGGGG